LFFKLFQSFIGLKNMQGFFPDVFVTGTLKNTTKHPTRRQMSEFHKITPTSLWLNMQAGGKIHP
jgi:hypothetical protein